MTGELVCLEYHEKIALVTFNRPEKRNTFNLAMWESLEGVTARLRERVPRAVVVTGEGDAAFSAGFDVNPENPQVGSLVSAVQSHDRSPVAALIKNIRRWTDGFFAIPVPVIAAINGVAYGGGAEFAVRCDMRFADPKSVICFSEVKLGLMPDWGGGAALTRLAGTAVAADLILTARKIEAGEALAMGLLNGVSDEGRVMDLAMERAAMIAANGPLSVRKALSVIRKTPDLDYLSALDHESEEATDLITAGECMTGIAAFLKGEKPVFNDPGENEDG